MNDFETFRELADDRTSQTLAHDRELMLTPLHTTRPAATRVLRCIECHRPWLDPVERWRLKVTDDTPPETVPYCARCASREFGPAGRPRAFRR